MEAGEIQQKQNWQARRHKPGVEVEDTVEEKLKNFHLNQRDRKAQIHDSWEEDEKNFAEGICQCWKNNYYPSTCNADFGKTKIIW